MKPDTASVIGTNPLTAKDFEFWFQRWHAKTPRRHSYFFSIMANEPLTECDDFAVYAVTFGHEKIICLLREKLTKDILTSLATNVHILKSHHGLTQKDSIGFLVQIFIIFHDFLESVGKEAISILSDYTWFPYHSNRVGATLASYDPTIQPIWQLESLLGFWEPFRESLIKLSGLEGQSCTDIPPTWISSEQVTIQREEKPWTARVPILPGSPLIPLAEIVLGDYQKQNSIMTDKDAPNSTSQVNREQGKLYGELIVSDAGRTINLRGKIYALTPTQAVAFGVLYDAYNQRIPDVTETAICDRLGYDRDKTTGVVKEVFKRLDGWQELIVKGGRKDMFRLNIEL